MEEGWGWAVRGGPFREQGQVSQLELWSVEHGVVGPIDDDVAHGIGPIYPSNPNQLRRCHVGSGQENVGARARPYCISHAAS